MTINTVPTDIALTLADGILGTMGNDSSSDNWRSLVDENASGAVVGTLSTTDPDSGDAHSYSLSGVGSELFEVDSSNQLKLKSGVSLDYETQSSYTLTITSTDSGGLSRSEDFIVNVIDVVENDDSSPGNDVLDGFSGNAIIDGGDGLDTVKYSVGSTEVSFSANDAGQLVIQNTANASAIESDALVSMERIQFTDTAYALDSDGNAGIAAKVIITTFGADSISTYMSAALSVVDSGTSLEALCDLVVELKLIDDLVGSSSNAGFVGQVFNNVVGRNPNLLESKLYTSYLDNGTYTKSSLLALAANTTLTANLLTANSIDLIGVPGSVDGELLAIQYDIG